MGTYKVILTEQQLNYYMQREMLCESKILSKILNSNLSKEEKKDKLLTAVSHGLTTVFTAMICAIMIYQGEPKEVVDQVKQEIVAAAPEQEDEKRIDDWKELCDDAIITVYNAVPEQCNSDVQHTASMYKLNLDDVGSHKICAMERTFMDEFDLHYGDVIKIEGTYKGLQDGVYQIQDTMNKRFAGKHKIDILVPNDIKYGGTLPGKTAKVYVLKDKKNTEKIKQLYNMTDSLE